MEVSVNKLAAASKFPHVRPSDTDFKNVDMPAAANKLPPLTPWE
jgi:hypothetical protein